MGKIYVGTCSWKYKSWQGIIYPEQGSFNFLEEYAKYFDTVEVDQWFWSLFGKGKAKLPDPKTVNEYAHAVSEHPNFRFTIKVPNSITLTHFYRKKKTDPLIQNPHFLSPELFRQFLDSLRPIWSKLGPLMFQFEYLNKQKMTGLPEFLDRFGSFLDSLPSGFQYAIETRNPNYLKKEFFLFLKEKKLSNVFLEGYYMPPIKDVYHQFHSLLISPVIFRLHGSGREDIEKISWRKWNRRYISREKDLEDFSLIFKRLLEKDIEVYVNVNNHYEGSAPLTIQRLKDKIFHKLQRK
jgi:uncharacterized protein YecE (DUF72 family)